jgi:alpha-1,3/alpha-1,6-mannosyltransferase
LDVRVRGDSFPHAILGRFAILCAIARQLILIIQISLLSNELRDLKPDVFFVDQLSAGVPLLRLVYERAHVLFYCHFPDKLLAKRDSPIKSLYRLPFDWIESWSTGCSDGIVVNSKFTRSVFGQAFPRLKHREPRVVYPCVNSTASEDTVELDGSQSIFKGDKIFLSINRFERKKDVGLAIRAYAGLSETDRHRTKLVIAGWFYMLATRALLTAVGGYDPRVPENVEYHKELEKLADTHGLEHATSKSAISAMALPPSINVLFLLSIPSSVKDMLLRTAKLIIYTPRNEHLGIVPLEGMLSYTPVLAANEGGPTETIVEGKTGWLRDAGEAEEWTEVLRKVIDGTYGDKELRQMGEEGHRRVKSLFSKEGMAQALDEEMERLERTPRPVMVSTGFLVVLTVFFTVKSILMVQQTYTAYKAAF